MLADQIDGRTHVRHVRGTVAATDTNTDREAAVPGTTVTVREAARILGTTIPAIRARIKRGTLTTVGLNEKGLQLVELPPGEYERAMQNPATQERVDLERYVEHLESEVEHLRAQVTDCARMMGLALEVAAGRRDAPPRA